MADLSKEPTHLVVVKTDTHTRRLKAVAWSVNQPLEGFLFVATKKRNYYFPISAVREFQPPHLDKQDEQ